MRVGFRADSSGLIGTGHLVRCLTLAAELASHGAQIAFACRDLPGHAAARVTDAGHALSLLSPPGAAAEWTGERPPHAHWLGVDWTGDARDTAGALLAGGPLDWLVVDHYALDGRWEAALCQAQQARHGRPLRVLAIDDLADRRHGAHMLLDQNMQAAGRYDGLLPPRCTSLLGPRYALVRPEFAQLRAAGPAQPRQGVLVYFGTAVLERLALDALAAFDETAPAGWTAHLLAPTGAPPAVQAAAKALGPQRCRLIEGSADMAPLMNGCGLAIGAAGTTSWERCTLGLPALLASVADNQLPGAKALAEAGAAIDLGRAESMSRADFARALARLFDDPQALAAMAQAAASLCDGQGAPRVAAAMAAAGLEIRPARQEDAAMLHGWRNSEPVRAASFDPREITLDDHVEWMRQVLANPRRHLLVARTGGEDCGCVRFDLSGEVATISVYLAPRWLGRGVGSAVIARGSEWLFSREPGARGIDAAIMPSNHASRRAFEKAGYRPAGPVLHLARGAG